MSTSERLSSPVDPTGCAVVVGIDVGSEHLVYTICQPDKRPLVKPTDLHNDGTGFHQLDQALHSLHVEPARILMGLEATSRYHENLYQFLAEHGYTLCLLHPRQTHQFAEQRGLRAKTDRLDATTIARVLLSGEARVGYVPDELIGTYRELERLHSRRVGAPGRKIGRQPTRHARPLPRAEGPVRPTRAYLGQPGAARAGTGSRP